jgi:hypothetical protein
VRRGSSHGRHHAGRFVLHGHNPEREDTAMMAAIRMVWAQ